MLTVLCLIVAWGLWGFAVFHRVFSISTMNGGPYPLKSTWLVLLVSLLCGPVVWFMGFVYLLVGLDRGLVELTRQITLKRRNE